MLKRILLAILAVFFAFAVMDFVIHGLILSSIYEATAELWRPMEEMNMPLTYLVTFVFSACMVGIYALLVSPKSLMAGVTLGVLLGIASGVSMGFGSYCYMPIPLTLAGGWFGGTLVECTVAGAIIGAIVKK